MLRKNIAVLFGGNSSEHEVSCVSAASIVNNISRDKYNLILIGITKKGKWMLYNGDAERIKTGEWENESSNKLAFISPDSSVKGVVVLNDNGSFDTIKLDAVIPVLHGKNGEDGTMQGLLELSGIPFVGCDTMASSACMDKIITNIILEHEGIDQAKFTWFCAYDFYNDPEKCIDRVESEIGSYPVFVKPSNAGSSVGVSKAKNRDELIKSIEIAANEDDRILIEESIDGQEVECAVLGNETPIASIVGEIAPSNEFYDYDAKYLSGSSDLYIPAHVSNDTSNKIRDVAIKAYKALGCTGLSRVDFFVERATERVMLNELNTFPGFTDISMYPKLMEASGIGFEELLDKLLKLALERNENKNAK